MTLDDSILSDATIACELLDKLLLKKFHLMEDKIRCEVNIEKSINEGSIHLAKSRYIMGQNSVCATRLPIESSPEFSASTVSKVTLENGVQQFEVLENDAENTVNPLRWFGVLVPQSLHKAQSIFKNMINYVVECANVQVQLSDTLNNIELLKKFQRLHAVEIGSVGKIL